MDGLDAKHRRRYRGYGDSGRAEVHAINGLSAQAEQAGLQRWHAGAGGEERTMLIDGESAAVNTCAAWLARAPGAMPAPGERAAS